MMRILLADDQIEVRSSLKILLEQDSGLKVVGEASELSSLLIQAEETNPDLVLLDWELSNLRVAEIIPVLRTLYPEMKIIATSGRPESSKVALAAGVDAFVDKGEQPEKLLCAVRNIAKQMMNKEK